MKPGESGGTPRILVFDSGVGGLSILAEVQRALPAAGFFYASDNEGFPYGTKAEADLLARVGRVMDRLVARVRPDILVVACNTASTLALPMLRASLRIPVVGVVPAIKPAAAQSLSRVIGLLATPATVARPYTDRLIEDFAPRCKVRRLGSAELVDLAERKLRGEPVTAAGLAPLIAPLFAGDEGARLDTIVLACTHFPLLLPELAAAAPRAVEWIDSAPAIARRVLALVAEMPAERFASAAHLPAPGRAFFTRRGEDVAALVPALAKSGLAAVEFL